MTRKLLPQANHKGSLRADVKKISAHSVDLPFDGIARNSTFGPPLRNHGTHPHRLNWKQGNYPRFVTCAFFKFSSWCLGVKLVAVQGEMRGLGNNTASKYSLEL